MSRASSALPALWEAPAEVGDDELVAATRDGDDRAFEALYERYAPRITAFAARMVADYARAEDIAQEVFVSALRRMRETDRPIAFRPWIYEIARNACIDHFRRTRRAEELSYDADEGLGRADHLRLATATGPDDAVEVRQEIDQLAGAFGGLSASHHRILVLRELEGLSYREIGERMELSRPAVESTLFRARKRLSEEYEDLASGRRCRRVQAAIAGAAKGAVAGRDRRRMERHLSYCQPCRRHAHLLGVQTPGRRGAAARLAALSPVPWFLRPRRGGDGGFGGLSGSQSAIAHLSSTLGAGSEVAATTWTKALAAAATVAVAGVGAGVAGHRADIPVLGGHAGPTAHHAKPAPHPSAVRAVIQGTAPIIRARPAVRPPRTQATAPGQPLPQDAPPRTEQPASPAGTQPARRAPDLIGSAATPTSGADALAGTQPPPPQAPDDPGDETNPVPTTTRVIVAAGDGAAAVADGGQSTAQDTAAGASGDGSGGG